jgi:LL-diaminopimelate aminotransferase
VQVADRLTHLPPYALASVEKLIAAERAKGVDVINLGIGSPDLAPPQFIIDALCESASRPDTHGYAGYFGIPSLLQALADYYGRRFGVELDAQSEIRPLLGSKEGLANSSLAFVDPGDLVLVPDPGYPTYAMGALLAGGSSYPMPLTEEHDFLVDFEAIPAEAAHRAKLMWLNYPNNPTGAAAPLDFLQRAVDFAQAHDLLICFDNPYCDLTFDGYVAPSILQVPGAKDVALEFNSLSKTYNMAGWRIGMAVGNAQAVEALTTVKTHIDSGIFMPIQAAAVAALNGDQSWLRERNLIYQRRRDIIMSWLPQLGMSARSPKGALYIWAKAPEGEDCADFCMRILKTKGVWMTPGTVYGDHGKGYIRLSLCASEVRLEQVGERLLST